MDTFDTQRLKAERLRPEHLDRLAIMHGDARVMATLSGVRSHDQTRHYLASNLAHWDRHGHGLWIFRDLAGNFIGRGALRHVELAGRDEVEIAYAVMSDYWGQGLATEIARALLEIGLERFGLADIVAFTLTANMASRRVMEKSGLIYEGEIDYMGLPHALYRTTPSRSSVPA